MGQEYSDLRFCTSLHEQQAFMGKERRKEERVRERERGGGERERERDMSNIYLGEVPSPQSDDLPNPTCIVQMVDAL